VKAAQTTARLISVLSIGVATLAFVATTAGIFTAFGHVHRSFLSLRGETVVMQGGGLYANESASVAAQGVGMDLVTLLVGIPLLLVSTYFARRGSWRGQLVRAGAYFYFTYSYLVILFGVAYNPMFLVYVALLSASVTGFVLSLLTVDVRQLNQQIRAGFARRTIAWTVIAVSGMFLLLWLSRIVPGLISGTPPAGLESYTTLSVQAADLSLVIPLSIVTGILLLRRHPVGYLLAAPVLVFIATMGLGLVGMVTAMALMGTRVGVADFVPAAITAIVGVAMVSHLVLKVEEPAGALPRAAGSSVRFGAAQTLQVAEGD
jgi:hypothetical protein